LPNERTVVRRRRRSRRRPVCVRFVRAVKKNIIIEDDDARKEIDIYIYRERQTNRIILSARAHRERKRERECFEREKEG